MTKRELTFENNFNAMQERVHQTAEDKGWWDDRRELIAIAGDVSDDIGKFAQKAINAMGIALMHSELSEGLEGERKDLPSDHIDGYDMIVEELADGVIRAMDFAQENNLDLAGAIIAKAKFNQTRSHKHGGKNY